MKYLAIIIGLVLSLSSFANNDKEGNTSTEEATPVVSTIIKGQIIDKETGDALTGVTVTLNDGREVYTDFDGYFSFEECGNGSYQIKTSLISYENLVLDNINIKSNDVKTLTIELSNL